MVSAPAITAPAPAIEHPLRNLNYRLWLIGGTISLFGDQFYLVALPWLILQQTGSAVAMGSVMMAGSIPRAVLMLLGGIICWWPGRKRVSATVVRPASASNANSSPKVVAETGEGGVKL